MRCINCGKPLRGNIDTYGDVGQELCWKCYSEITDQSHIDMDCYRLRDFWKAILNGELENWARESLSKKRNINK